MSEIAAGGVRLAGALEVPEGAIGVVVFAHGSGSSRHSPRNRAVAEVLRRAGLGTVLVDLLTEEEELAERRTGHLRFDIDLLAGRLADVAAWVRAQPATAGLPVGYFGASTGGGAALVAAARDPAGIGAVVSRGGRPDLAGAALEVVRAPTLLLVGSADPVVLDLNRQALDRLGDRGELRVVRGATHLFEEPGTLEEVARHAARWFTEHLGGSSREERAGGGEMDHDALIEVLDEATTGSLRESLPGEFDGLVAGSSGSMPQGR